jgi:hypothetical protein
LLSSDGTAPSIVIVPKHFYPIPSHGYLEFDFVNIHRPTIVTCRPAQDYFITDCLLLSRLIENDDMPWALGFLREMLAANRTTMFPSGKPSYRVGTGRAERIAAELTNLYGSLHQRQATRKLSQTKESLANVQRTKSVELESSSISKQKTVKEKLFGEDRTKKKGGAFADASNAVPSGSCGLRNLFATSIDPSGPGEGEQEESLANLLRKKGQPRFRNLTKQGRRAKHKLNQWEMRMIEVVYGSKGSDEYKAAALLEFFEIELATCWLECRHVAILLDVFSTYGQSSRSNFGSYRVELLIILFDRIIDLHNVELIWAVLNAEEHAALIARVGYLNLFNPCKCEGGWSLSLSRWEEVQLIRIMVHLSVVEPGQNLLNPVFALYRGSAPVPSWELNRTWFSEDGMPRNGQISFEMYAGNGLRLANCSLNPILRQMLTSLTLVAQRNYLAEIDFLAASPLINAVSSTCHASPAVKTRGGIIAGRSDDDDVGNDGNQMGVELNSHEVTGLMTNHSIDALFSSEQLLRVKESLFMHGLSQYQRFAVYALIYGTKSCDDWLQQQEGVGAEHEERVRRAFTEEPSDQLYRIAAPFTVQDAHDHLERATDIKWKYAPIRKPDAWSCN